MNNINKTLYIPLYGKAYVSQKGIILIDKQAENIWGKERFELKGKSKSKWLAYYMGMRSAVFDKWTKNMISTDDCLVLHIGCGLDSRCLRVNALCDWYDIDFPEVIEERKKYYAETNTYHMISSDIRSDEWLKLISENKRAIVVMEGVSMYLSLDELKSFLNKITHHFSSVNILMDCYSEKAAKASKYINPINDVGVTAVYGIDNPHILEDHTIQFICEHDMTPVSLIHELKGLEKFVFKHLFAGSFAKSMYKLYEYKTR